MKAARFHPDAEAEVRQALAYYAGQRHGLDSEFRHELEVALNRVRENPLICSVEYDVDVRYCSLKRFPYQLVFLELSDCVWIAAVAHQRRRPHYWMSRSPD